jgi:hypothetical protein
MGAIMPGKQVSFRDENGEVRYGTVLAYTGANDGTGRYEYRVECGRFVYGVSEDAVTTADDPARA